MEGKIAAVDSSAVAMTSLHGDQRYWYLSHSTLCCVSAEGVCLPVLVQVETSGVLDFGVSSTTLPSHFLIKGFFGAQRFG